MYDVLAQRKPVGVVALYNPHATSCLNSGGKQWTIDIMERAALESARLWVKYGFVVAGGDYNWRLGSTSRRRTDDRVTDKQSARMALAQKWHQQTNLRSLYGQDGQRRGVCTSRTGTGQAEVDYINVCKVIPPWTVEALEVPEWERYSERGGVHRPVGIAVLAPVVDDSPAARPEGHARGMPMGGGGTTNATNTQPPTKRTPPPALWKPTVSSNGR